MRLITREYGSETITCHTKYVPFQTNLYIAGCIKAGAYECHVAAQ